MQSFIFHSSLARDMFKKADTARGSDTGFAF